MGDTLEKQTGINLEQFAEEWKLFGRNKQIIPTSNEVRMSLL